ncbi:DUF881 domain-containing protein [Bacillus spongiae]|uniref:DUF881 domain-containing protein n=1 Tax=Bacillus spongiae TaxID=2683610 RepID=A0ABU8H9T4_9BACI
MKKRAKISFTVITMIIGFMLMIQFKSVKEPVVRDTRDIWELRDDLLKEKEMHSTLLQEIRSVDETLERYESERQTSKEQALKETVEELKMKAGLTPITGPGIILTVEPVLEDIMLGNPVQSVSPELLKWLLNELNQYGAYQLSIDHQRVVNTSVIRDINGETTVNTVPITNIPFEIKVITKDLESAEKLSNQMRVSKVVEAFYREKFKISISAEEEEITLPAYNRNIRNKLMEPVE